MLNKIGTQFVSILMKIMYSIDIVIKKKKIYIYIYKNHVVVFLSTVMTARVFESRLTLSVPALHSYFCLEMTAQLCLSTSHTNPCTSN